jgi:hypothetical protein
MDAKYKQRLEAVFQANGWNADRVIRSFVGKGGYEVVSMENCGQFCIQVEFRQVRLEEYGFRVRVALLLTDTMDRFRCYLYTDDVERPLHEPVEIPVLYGFTAQTNQMHRVVSGLEYVYRVAGVKGLQFFPHGKRELAV